jgi:hypothetical protein
LIRDAWALESAARRAVAALAASGSHPDAKAELQRALMPERTPEALEIAALGLATLSADGARGAAALRDEAGRLREKNVDDRASRIVGDDVLLCLSWAVSVADRAYGERDAHDSRVLDDEELDELRERQPDVDDYADNAPDGYMVESDGDGTWRWRSTTLGDDGEPDECGDWQGSALEAWEDLFDDQREEKPSGGEVFEHWAVSRHLAERLERHGEAVTETAAFGFVWGRATTGQMIQMDHVIRTIAGELECQPEPERAVVETVAQCLASVAAAGAGLGGQPGASFRARAIPRAVEQLESLSDVPAIIAEAFAEGCQAAWGFDPRVDA